MKQTIFFGLALLFLVQAPFVFSLSCEGIAEQSACFDILSSGLSEEEQALLISNLDYKKQFFPDHDFVYNHNINVDVADAPDGVVKKNGIYVRDVWMSLLTQMPSVKYNDSLYCSDNAKVLSAYDYRVEIPSNYYSSGYPSTSQGDCKRIYNLIENKAENNVYVNGNYQGEGKLVDVNINSDSEIEARYSINVAVDIDHYRWHSYCCARNEFGGCVRTCHTCRYSYDETKSDNIVIKDNVSVKHYDSDLYADLEVKDTYSSTKIGLDYSNSLELDFQDSSYDYHEFVYDIDYSKQPYLIYTLRAEDYGRESVKNLIHDNNDIYVKNTAGCNLKAFDFFNSFENNCNLEYEDVDFSIKTDRLKYKPNETITVSIYPDNIPVSLTYNNKTIEAQGSAVFTAVPLKNKIVANYKHLESQAVVYVADEDRFSLIIHLSIFALLNYCFYCVGKKFYGVVA